MNNTRPSNGVSSHILPTSATMVGVCVTVIGIVRLIETGGTMATVVDNVVAVASALFLTAALTSYVSIRSSKHQERLESYADVIFMIGLVIMVVASFMLAWEIGQHPLEVAPLPESHAPVL